MKYLIFFLSFSVQAEAIQLTFTSPVEREDGTALTQDEIKEYRVFIDGVQKKIIPNSPNNFWLQVPGQYDAITMKTVDTDGRKSAMSQPLTNKAPKPPTP